jgi:hypothetical protein
LAHDLIERIEGLALVYTELRGGGAPAHCRHVELARRQRAQVPSRGGRPVTQDGGIDAATCQHRRPHPSALRKAGVADRVHAAVNPVQPPSPDPQLNRAVADTGGP